MILKGAKDTYVTNKCLYAIRIKFTESCRSWEAEAENPDFKASIGYLASLKVT